MREEKEMAAPQQMAEVIFLLAAKFLCAPGLLRPSKIHLRLNAISPQLEPKNIRESILDFTALWGEINPDMPYLCRRGLSGSKKAFLPLSPSVWRKAMKKNVKSSIFDEKTSKFSRLLSFKSLTIENQLA